MGKFWAVGGFFAVLLFGVIGWISLSDWYSNQIGTDLVIAVICIAISLSCLFVPDKRNRPYVSLINTIAFFALSLMITRISSISGSPGVADSLSSDQLAKMQSEEARTSIEAYFFWTATALYFLFWAYFVRSIPRTRIET